MKPFLSFIIPVYNVEKYIEKCLDSIINQDNGEIEVIIINDGSKDKTLDICRKYENDYDFIKVFSQENQGQSVARNFAITKASGEYINYLDGDDFLPDGAVEKIFTEIKEKKPDIAIGLYDNYYEAENRTEGCGYCLEKEKVETLNGEDLLCYLMTDRVYDWYPWLMTYRKDLITDNGFLFKPGVIFEDAKLIPEIIINAASVCYIDSPVYVYRRNRTGSSTATFSEKTFNDKLEVYSFIEDFSKKYSLSQKTKELLCINTSNMYVSALFDTWSIDSEKRNGSLKLLKKYDFILQKSPRRYHNLLYIFRKIFGIKLTSYILYIRAEWVRKNKIK